MSHPHLQIVIGSTRPARRADAVAQWIHDAAIRHDRFDVELIDLREVALPLLDEPQPPGRGPYTQEHTRRWSRLISAGDAYVFVVPEYNHSYNAATKNALDYLKDEWRHKPIAFVSYGGGSAAGARAVHALTPVVVSLSMRPLSRSVGIPLINRMVTGDGALRTDERLDNSALTLLDELFQLTDRMSKGSHENVVLEPGFGDRGRRAEQSA
ncbi:MAG TPA: NAD(P)H-dependent oxidoreductase [Pseudonocardiaceae bacterium]|jgi:NAD(P)H-dependent FMN reductase